MSLLARFLALGEPTRDPTDARWWQSAGVGPISHAGVRVDGDTALKASAVFAAVRIIAETLGSLPFFTYRETAVGRDRAPDHPLYPILHDQPNAWQTAQEWLEMMTGHCLLRGNAYSQIQSGPRGFVAQLIPLHPDRVTPERIPGTMRLRYKVRDLDTGVEATLSADQMFHFRGLSSDGFVGLSVLQLAREPIGLALALEGAGARLFSQGIRPSGAVEMPANTTKTQRDEVRAELVGIHAGLSGLYRPMVLEGGMKWQQVGLTNEDAQFIESRDFQVRDIARWFNIPEHMLRASKAPTYASIEQFAIEFVRYTLRPWATRWKQAVKRDLIVEENVFAEFLLDALLQGTTLDRFEAYRIATGGHPWMTPNEVRELENMNPKTGLDEVKAPLNMGDPGGDPRTPRPPRRRRPDEEDEEAARVADARTGHAERVLATAAARAVRRELEALRTAAKRHGDTPAAWQTAVDELYQKHTLYLAEALGLSLEAARTYARDHRATVLADGIRATETWAETAPAALLALVEEDEHDPADAA